MGSCIRPRRNVGGLKASLSPDAPNTTLVQIVRQDNDKYVQNQ